MPTKHIFQMAHDVTKTRTKALEVASGNSRSNGCTDCHTGNTRGGAMEMDGKAMSSRFTGKSELIKSLDELTSLFSTALCGKTLNEAEESTLCRFSAWPWAIVAITTANANSKTPDDLARLAENSAVPCIVATFGNVAFACTPHENARELAEGIVDASNGLKAAYSLPIYTVADIHAQRGLVQYALSSSPDNTAVVNAKDHVLPYFKVLIGDKVDTAAFVHPALKKLTDYDNANQSNMLETLKIYLENDRNAQKCASILYLHRNSLQYRVKRIQEVAGINLDDDKERMYLRLSLFFNC